MNKVLVIDDDPDIRATMTGLCRRMDLSCDTAGTLERGLDALRDGGHDVVFLDVRLPDGDGLTALPRIKALPDSPEVIILTGQGDPDGAGLAIQEGVWDYLVKPSPIKQIMLSLSRALRYRQDRVAEKNPVALRLQGLVAESPRMRASLDLVAQAARGAAGVLLTGETGTGKELFARTIHANSARAERPFVVVDCAAMTETLVESVLFGHKKGAFTGAEADRVGLVSLAHGGTLFLDEVGELPMTMQKAFLRVLYEKRFRPVGGVREEHSDFRLVAATNRDLSAMVAAGGFRDDLYFRLKTVAIELPPLRARPEDIVPLTLARVRALSEAYGAPQKGFDADFLRMLSEYDWPGNVRELFGVLERAFVAAGGDRTLYPMHLPHDIRIQVTRGHIGRGVPAKPAPFSPLPAPADPEDLPDPPPTLKEYKEIMERRYLGRLHAKTGGDMKRLADLSGLSRSHLYALLKKYDLSVDGERN